MMVEGALALLTVVQMVSAHHPWASCRIKAGMLTAPTVVVHVPPCLFETGMKPDCSFWFGYVGMVVNTCRPLRMVSYRIAIEPARGGRGSEVGSPPRLVVQRLDSL
jgi:hypothetical protein